MEDIGKESAMFIRRWVDYDKFIKDTSPTATGDGFIVHKSAVYDIDEGGNRILKEPGSERIYLSMHGEPVNECALVGVLFENKREEIPIGGIKTPQFQNDLRVDTQEEFDYTTRALENALSLIRCEDCQKCDRRPASGRGGSIWCANRFLREAEDELKGEELWR